jgi:hypothetical protein
MPAPEVIDANEVAAFLHAARSEVGLGERFDFVLGEVVDGHGHKDTGVVG